MNSLRRLLPSRNAAASSRSDNVSARLLKSGAVVILNGDSLYRFQSDAFQRLMVGAGATGTWELIGVKAAGEQDVLASFGSEQGARRAYAAVTSLYFRGAGWMTVMKWLAGLLLLWFVLGAFSKPVQADIEPSMGGAAAPAVGGLVPPGGSAAFDPNEPNMDSVLSGQYTPNIRVEVPEVKTPALNCAPKASAPAQ